MTKKTSVAGAFARKEPYEYESKQFEADIQQGDKVKFLDEGTIVAGEFGEQNVFTIQTRNGEKNIALNQSSINTLVDTFGDESAQWIGKEANVLLKKDVVASKKVIIAYLVPDGWYLDDFGDLVKDQNEASQEPQEELKPEDIPF